MEITAYSSKELADDYLAKYLHTTMKEMDGEMEGIVLAVSGGSTPFAMYEKLAALLREDAIAQLHIIQIDERFVEASSDRSNQRQLLPIFGEIASFHPMVSADKSDSLEEAVKQTEERYLSLLEGLGKPGPDISLLGMGQDGHTASLFPRNQVYLDTIQQKPGIIGMYVNSQQEERISCNVNLINHSTRKILYAFGEAKLQTLNQALLEQNQEKFPVLSVLDNIELVSLTSPSLYRLDDTWLVTNRIDRS